MAWNQPGNKGNSGNGGQSSGTKRPFPISKMIGIGAVVVALVWGVSGFYTINQSQRGVITRFGKMQPNIIEPGLNWKPSLIDNVYIVDTQGTRNFNVQGFMITAGENLVFVEMNVQYRISNPLKYLFNVTNVDDSLRQAADSALRTEVGSSNMDSILTDGRSALESRTKDELINIIAHYDMGISIVDLNFQSARPPEEVQEAFNDAIKAREDREREINKAEADRVQLVQQAEGRAARILADANAYKVRVELEAAGDVTRFEQLLPQYKAAPEITKERLYIETMEKILTNTRKVIVNEKSGNLMVLPLDQLLKSKLTDKANTDVNTTPSSDNGYNFKSFGSSDSMDTTQSASSVPQNNITTQGSTNGTTRTIRR